MDVLFFKIALIASLISSLGYVISFLAKRVLAAKISMWVLLMVFLFLTASFGFRCLTTGQSGLTSFHGTLSFFAWTLAGIYLLLQLQTKTRVLGIIVAPMVFVILIGASLGIEEELSIPAMLTGSLVPLHIVLALTGEALFILASGSGAMYLIQSNLLKRKRVGGLTKFLPSLTDLDRTNHICLLIGFPLLTLGIIIGSIWARTVWGSHWQWDPKQIWTLLAWLVYGFLLNQRFTLGWKGHRIALLSVIAFCLLLLSYIAVELFLPTIHRFV